ncbi:hypothetical protein FRC07_013996, partial [Ceratobasidium sp. 392]
MATETEQMSIPLQNLPSITSPQNSQLLQANSIRLNGRRDESEIRQEGRNDIHPALPEELAAAVLPPVDRGFGAWSFIAAAFVIETLVWGLGFSYGVFQESYISHKTFGAASEAAIGAVGTTTLAIGYFECLVIVLIAQHWPDKIRTLIFATRVWHLQLLQGVCFGIGCGGLYAPVLVYLSEWFSAKRGLAGSIIFGGSGIGGAVFPITINFLLSHFGF